MKSAAFDYCRPADVDEACAILAAEEDARIIAGGQSLVPMMAMRLVRPTRLVDIARIPALTYVRQERDAITIGAGTRQCVLERDPLIAAQVPLLAEVLPWIGHAAIRARGTIGGSLAHADPAAEIMLVAVTLDAVLVRRVGGANEEIPARDFFLGLMTTALPPGSCLTAARFPCRRPGRVGVGFHEINARRSDFAFASAAAQISIDAEGACEHLALGIGAVTEVPFRLEATEIAMTGRRIETEALRRTVTEELTRITPMADLHASADYRRRAAAALAVRAVMDAVVQAQAGDGHAR